jgi:hypothetical protein
MPGKLVWWETLLRSWAATLHSVQLTLLNDHTETLWKLSALNSFNNVKEIIKYSCAGKNKSNAGTVRFHFLGLRDGVVLGGATCNGHERSPWQG